MSPTRTSSRLARKEQDKIVRQTVVMIVAALTLGLGFIFFVLPFSIRIITSLTNSDQVPTSQNTLPPQVPILFTPPSATSSAQVAITGFAQPENEIVLLVNGEQHERRKVTTDGTFEFQVQLQEGATLIAAYAVDTDKKESDLSQTYTVTKDTQVPKLEIAEPLDNQTVELRRNQNVTVAGTTDPGVQLTLNGRLIYAQEDGVFRSTYLLQEGDNTLEFIATDQAGNQTKKEITVQFSL